MCGIAGLFKHGAIEPTDVTAVLRMIASQQHRGPDDWGLLLPDDALSRADIQQLLADRDPNHMLTYRASSRGRLILGSRRLSILALSPAGRMPMASESRDVFITYNGEIYNYRSARKELKGRGCIFHSDSDTEVIL